MGVLTENGRLAIDSLRNAPEGDRAFGVAIFYGIFRDTPLMCACAFLAKPLGVDLVPGTSTSELIAKINQKTGIPVEILDFVPKMNDGKTLHGSPRYSFREIADWLEQAIQEP